MILLLVVQESNLDGATTTIDSEGLWGLRIIASVANANAKEPWKRMVAIEEKKNELWHFGMRKRLIGGKRFHVKISQTPNFYHFMAK